MKKYLKPIIGIILVSVLVFLGYSITKKISYKNEVAERIRNIPKFSFLNLNNAVFTQNGLTKNSYKLFVYFNSECEYCQSEAAQISKNIKQFKNTQLIFVSYEPFERIKQFAKTYNLLNKKNIAFLQDKEMIFEELFDAKSIPFMLLYSKENQLIEKYKGATKVNNILKHIN
ncbi:peroxiredoxin family protein [Lutibacter sp.]